MTALHFMAGLGLLLACLSACSHPPPKVEWPVLHNGFGVESFTHSKDRLGEVGHCSKLVVSEGNGLFGYQSFIVDDENNVEVRLFDDSNTRLETYRRPAHVFKTRMSGTKPLIESLVKSLDLGHLWHSYQTSFADGPGGGFAMVGRNGEVCRCHMSNYFPPEFHELWSRIHRLVEQVPEGQWKYQGRVSRILIEKEYMHENQSAKD
ncbi:MAG: hypothetical protein ACYC67_16845 [Prosthecobacter sp.]